MHFYYELSIQEFVTSAKLFCPLMVMFLLQNGRDQLKSNLFHKILFKMPFFYLLRVCETMSAIFLFEHAFLVVKRIIFFCRR
jgi:hypothetical protein